MKLIGFSSLILAATLMGCSGEPITEQEIAEFVQYRENGDVCGRVQVAFPTIVEKITVYHSNGSYSNTKTHCRGGRGRCAINWSVSNAEAAGLIVSEETRREERRYSSQMQVNENTPINLSPELMGIVVPGNQRDTSIVCLPTEVIGDPIYTLSDDGQSLSLAFDWQVEPSEAATTGERFVSFFGGRMETRGSDVIRLVKTNEGWMTGDAFEN